MSGSGKESESNEAYGEVWLGDLLLALAGTTHGDGEACVAWAVEMLGLSERLSGPLRKSGDNPHDAGNGIVHPAVEQQVESKSSDPERERPPVPTDQPIPYAIVSQRLEVQRQSLQWREDAEPLPEVTDAQIEMRPPLAPLFNPKTSRALISTAFSTQRNEGAIDFATLFDQICALRPVTRLPRLPVSTMRFGIQLLIDRGQGTWPYYGDQESVRDEILGIVGRDRVETLYFSDSPLRGFGAGSRSGWKRPYEPPAAGTPVVVVTDLGIGRGRNPDMGAGVEEWLRFAEAVHSAECPLLALVPYGEPRWPGELRKAMYILCWDRGTHVSLVRRIVGHGLEVRPSL
jgi:hypothetical protein